MLPGKHSLGGTGHILHQWAQVGLSPHGSSPSHYQQCFSPWSTSLVAQAPLSCQILPSQAWQLSRHPCCCCLECSIVLLLKLGSIKPPPPPENCQDWWLVLTSVLRTCSCWRVGSTFLLYPILSVYPWWVQFALRLLKNINKHLQERQCWNFLTRHIKLLYRHKMIVSEPKEYIQSWNLTWEAFGIFFLNKCFHFFHEKLPKPCTKLM